jgi:hypothetical protein
VFSGANRTGGRAKAVLRTITRKHRREKMIKWTKYSVEKASEGGLSQENLKERAVREGFRVRFTYSCYVGQYGVEVNTADKRKLNRFEKNVLGW